MFIFENLEIEKYKSLSVVLHRGVLTRFTDFTHCAIGLLWSQAHASKGHTKRGHCKDGVRSCRSTTSGNCQRKRGILSRSPVFLRGCVG